ncbi:ras-related protein Rab-30-like [Stylophora pistillata]|uniref:Ras-related protein Rab-43 n=1 Tax=Stylophora pistillata TaxID=50429 RepID=A0A2B4RKX8_STYPI|nr:ras-related protein Rab-30-like [Stylophora pistillata]XP_022804314.1 ras-related protein Rab-30-like [Stylophora pistillata]PFX16902.1 Ras-related protein Rab-30 [Stylophora pistillata]PFX19230.1 Ras-related protein Rab-30 [Stylophora pistillata]
MDDYNYLFKIILIGDANVGKTCLVKRFAKGFFTPSQGPTIGVDFTIRTVEVDGERVKLQVWDTAGQERFRSVTQSYYHNADGVIITYDITSRKSFDNLQQHWLEDVRRFTSKKVLMYIVGNKSDLSQERQVDFRSAQMIAEEEHCDAMETSAKEADNVENLFESLATQLMRNIKNVEGNETKDNLSPDENGTKDITLGGHSICARGLISCCRV